MAQDLDFALEHVARAWGASDGEALAFYREQAFQGDQESGGHNYSDGLPRLMFTRFDNIVSGTKLGVGIRWRGFLGSGSACFLSGSRAA